MRIKGLGDKSQKSHIRAIKDFAAFLGRSPDTATPDDLRAYELHMTGRGVTPPACNARLIALRFFFETTCGRGGMKRHMQFRTRPRKLPVAVSAEEVEALLRAAPGPELKYRAALSISCGARHRAPEVCNLKVSGFGSDRMLIHAERGKGRKVMLPPGLPNLLREYGGILPNSGW